MPIQIVTAYRVGELVLPTIQEAQKTELLALLDGGASDGPLASKDLVDLIVARADEVVAILTCEPKGKSPRKPRSDIGKKRKAKAAAEQDAL